MNAKIEIGLPQTRRGSACKYAWKTNRATARLVVDGASVIIAATGRLISWRSGNFSSQAERIYNKFVSRWADRELSVHEALALIPDGAPGSRQVKLALRNEIYNQD